jgi:hypothetical protein
VTRDSFYYQCQKLKEAQFALMAPHPEGEDKSFAFAFQYCKFAFMDFDETQVKDKDASRWIETIKRLMDTSDIREKTDEGAWLNRARAMSLEEKSEFSLAVFELAGWFRG